MRLAKCLVALLLLPEWPAGAASKYSPIDACTDAASLIRGIPSLRLTPIVTASDSHFCVPRGAAVTTFSGRGSMTAFPDASTPDAVLHGELAKRGWRACTECSADGPDGTVWAVAKGEVMVVVEGRWDGGDDTEPDAPVRDVYEIIVRCLERLTCQQTQAERDTAPGACEAPPARAVVSEGEMARR